jgi:predicted flap endonuclease-1-like 5' DNA nuclease
LILDQHLEIISSLIGDEKMEAINKKIKPADPLHWIMGIDEDVSKRLQNQGIKTFTQISSLPKKEIRKLMDQFEEIEEKVIESWPLQASAILNTQEHK